MSVKVRISILELLVTKNFLAQRARPGAQRAVEKESLTSLMIIVILVVRGVRASWFKGWGEYFLGSFQ